jgi:hypothetical protein
MKIEGSVSQFWRFLSVAMFFLVFALCIYGAFFYASDTATGLDQWLKWPIVICIVVIGIICFRFPFKGICGFHYDGNVLSTINLVTGRIAKHNLSEIEKIKYVQTRGSHDIIFKNGNYIVVGLWGVSNINILLAQLRKDIKAYKN